MKQEFGHLLTPLKIENFIGMLFLQDQKWPNEPGTIEHRFITDKRTKDILLTGINQLKTTQATGSYWKDIGM